MDINFDVNKVFQERLAASMGLDKYQFIMEQVKKTDVSIDADFQRTFNLRHQYEKAHGVQPHD